MSRSLSKIQCSYHTRYQTRRSSALQNAAITIQRHVRGYQCRCRCRRLMSNQSCPDHYKEASANPSASKTCSMSRSSHSQDQKNNPSITVHKLSSALSVQRIAREHHKGRKDSAPDESRSSEIQNFIRAHQSRKLSEVYSQDSRNNTITNEKKKGGPRFLQNQSASCSSVHTNASVDTLGDLSRANSTTSTQEHVLTYQTHTHQIPKFSNQNIPIHRIVREHRRNLRTSSTDSVPDESGSSRVQKLIRAHQSRKVSDDYTHEFQNQQKAATTIQKHVRGYQARKAGERTPR